MLLDKHRDCRCINCQWEGMINMDDEYVCPKCGKEVMVGYTGKEIMESSQYGFYHTPEVYKTSQSKEEFKKLVNTDERLPKCLLSFLTKEFPKLERPDIIAINNEIIEKGSDRTATWTNDDLIRWSERAHALISKDYDRMKAFINTASVCELATVNLNVNHYMEHWETRAIKAEEELQRYKEWADWVIGYVQKEFGRDLQTQASS